jgi:carboxyl-terminal processing protease
VNKDEGFKMLTERSRLVREVEEQKRVSLREDERRAEDERRNQRFKADQEQFLRARGLTPVDEEADQVDEEALEKQREVIARIEAEEAARILADGILMQRGNNGPRAVMRD